MATLADREINCQDYVDFCNLDDLSDEDIIAIFAALFEDTLPISNPTDSKPSSSSSSSSNQEHSHTIQPPKSPLSTDWEINFQDSADFCEFSVLSDEDARAIFAAINNQTDSFLNSGSSSSSSQQHSFTSQPPKSPTKGSVPHVDFTVHEAEELPLSREDNQKESSLPVPEDPQVPPTEIYCGICMETKPRAEFFNTNFCEHLYCNECVASYVIDKVEDSIGWINCPEPGCEAGFLDPDTCHLMIPQAVSDRWGKLICEAMIQVKFYCPYKDCSAVLMNDHESSSGEQEIITVSECPYCNRLFCAQCQTAWHQGINCEEFQRLDEGERGAEDLLLRQAAHSSKWQRCPKCRFFVERNQGCNHITCRCRFEFCYVCGENWSSSHYNCRNK